MGITLYQLVIANYFTHCHSERSEESSAMWQKKAGFFAALRMTNEELIR